MRRFAIASLMAFTAMAASAGPTAAQVETDDLGEAPPSLRRADQDLYPGAWSYFGDPRSMSPGMRVLTGGIATDRSVVIHQYDRQTRQITNVRLHRNEELDDHDNPSLALWRGRVYAFYSPHSGRIFPRNRKSRMRYRVTRRGLDIRGGFGPERQVPTNTPGGLGFTYPNPIATRDKLWLFWRGGDWDPTFSYTRDGVHWAKARTLVRGPRGQRPYAKYTSGPDGSIHVVLSQGHPGSYPTSLYYVRYRAGRFYRADGRVIGTMDDLPLSTGRLDRIYRYREDTGRAWPQDVAVARVGRPIVTFTTRRGGPQGRDVYFYARWDGRRWRRFPVVDSAAFSSGYYSGGITIHHSRPSWVVLSRRIGSFYQIELWRTEDGGRTWRQPVQLTKSDDSHSFRPVIPRLFNDPSTLIVIYVHGTYRSYRSFQTAIRITVNEEIPRGVPFDPEPTELGAAWGRPP